MNEYQKAYLALSKALLFCSNPLVIAPKTPFNTTENLHSSLRNKIFYDKENDKIYIFTYDKNILDCCSLLDDINKLTNQNKQSLQDYDIAIFLDSTLLLGSSEIESNPLFFGELDKEGVFIESKPVYHLIGEIDYDTKDSKERFTQTLQVFLDNNTLTLLNYSLLDSSLNIKLECNSSESKAILEKEKAQREQQKQESKAKDSQSTSMLHPILEDNEIKCPHNGVVQLKSNKGKSFTSKGIPLASKGISFIFKMDSPLFLKDILFASK